MDCAWSLPDHFQGISSVPPDLLHGWFLKKEGWVGGVAYLPSCTPKSTIVHGTCPRMKVCQGPIKPNGNSAMYFCQGCAHLCNKSWFSWLTNTPEALVAAQRLTMSNERWKETRYNHDAFVYRILCKLFDPVFWEFKITASKWSLHLITITLTSTRPDDAKLECSSVGVYVGGNSVGWVWGGSFQRRWGRLKSSGSVKQWKTMLQLSLNALYAGCHGSTVCLYSDQRKHMKGWQGNSWGNMFKRLSVLMSSQDDVWWGWPSWCGLCI